MNEAGVAPPGVMPIQQPISVLRIDVIQYLGSFFQVSMTMRVLMRAAAALELQALFHRQQDLADAEQADHRDQEVEAAHQLGCPNVSRNWPVTVSMPTAASAKPSIIDARIFIGEPLPMPTKLQKVSK